MDSRLIPACMKSVSLDIPAGVGLTSRVISAFSDSCACRETVSRIAAIVAGCAKLGVPPPKNIEVILTTKTKQEDFQQHAYL